jgi:CRP/FNR family transcriptional regulator, cyclic AMP receptor protein
MVDHLFNSSEKRPSCALLLLARYGKEETPQRLLSRVSQETLAK